MSPKANQPEWVVRKIAEDFGFFSFLLGLLWIGYGLTWGLTAAKLVSTNGLGRFDQHFLYGTRLPAYSSATDSDVAFFVVVLISSIIVTLSGLFTCMQYRWAIYGAMLAGGVLVLLLFAGVMKRLIESNVDLDTAQVIMFAILLIPIMLMVASICLNKARKLKEARSVIKGAENACSGIQGIIHLLHHRNTAVRIQALKQLGELGPDAAPAVSAIIEQLLGGVPPPSNERNVCEICGTKLTLWNRNLGSPQCAACVYRLLAVANGDYRPTVAEVAAETLGRIGLAATTAIPALRKTCKSKGPYLSQQSEQAIAAIEGAGNITP